MASSAHVIPATPAFSAPSLANRASSGSVAFRLANSLGIATSEAALAPSLRTFSIVAPGWEGNESELALRNKLSVAGAKLVDKKGKKRYLVLRDTEGRCLCTSFGQPIQAGKSKTWYAQFPAPPKGNDKVEFQIADMPPATVTIGGGE